ncbi:hypothetical protein [Alkalithermobacter paradoxus]|uniref:Polymerase nucleotidyl transferase domain-containing protein n=1 Tax=Alkalithermobacter paradoxus TaxID=29349 RepID=A0A1V4IAT7_9FIRM|nr:hypothetical protein CLOTH_03280 [[Clostridium] thermoalcaliphilum]
MDRKYIFESEISNLKNDINTLSIILVGSSRHLDFSKITNDIDIFVIMKDGKHQSREIKSVGNLEFDISYFPLELVKKLIKDKTQFFIENMTYSKLVYDVNGCGRKYIDICAKDYSKGPGKLTDDEAFEIQFFLIDDIKRIKTKTDINKCEINYLYSVYLKNALHSYFRLNNKWVPKDKKIFKVLEKEDETLYKMIKDLYETYDVNILEEIVSYIFKKSIDKEYINMTYKRGDDLNG